MTTGPEFTLVEQPFIEQFVSMGWKYTSGSLDHPSVTGRESFHDVLFLDDLEKAMVHLHEPNHTFNFWLRVEQVMPDYGQGKNWLAEHGCQDVVL